MARGAAWGLSLALVCCVSLGVGCSSKTGWTGGSPMGTGGSIGIGGSGAAGGGTPLPSGGAGSGGAMSQATGGTVHTGGVAGAAGGGAGGSSGTPGAGGNAGQGGGGAGGGGGSAGQASSVDAGPPPTPADYKPTGPYGATKKLLNQGAGTVTGGSAALLPFGNTNDASAFTLFFPQGGPAGERLPLLTWGDGTFCSPTFYDALINHVVSYGFIVVATNTSSVGTGVEMLKAVEWALAQDQDSKSPIYGRVDRDHIGALGHSQGGAGTVMVGADPRIRAIAPLSGAPLSGTRDASVGIQCPTFYITTEGDIATPDSIHQAYDYTPTPAVFGVTKGGNHDEYTDIADDPHLSGLTSNDGLRVRAAIAAWFDWQLKGKTALRSLFVGPQCGFCSDPNWKTFESKGL